ncbi:MAG: pyruvate, water dikinase regulatory protein [Pseudomonadota bacterium]
MNREPSRYFHLHLVSDSTGETLTAISKAASVQYSFIHVIEHVHPLVRTKRQLERVLQDIDASPGIVLYTIVSEELGIQLEESCKALNIPCVAVLKPVMETFENYFGAPSKPKVGGQHVLNSEYFRRMEALNFTMMHDDGNLPENLKEADIVLVGISRTSKTPTSIYLANRGFKAANLPLVPDLPISSDIEERLKDTFVVGLIASPERISQIRRNRVDIMTSQGLELKDYVDRDLIAREIAYTRRLCSKNNWPIIDVTRRSIEETAAAIIKLHSDKNIAEKAFM